MKCKSVMTRLDRARDPGSETRAYARDTPIEKRRDLADKWSGYVEGAD